MSKFNFIYGNEVEQFNFLAIPKMMFSDSKFKSLSLGAKVLYSFMLERTKYSCQNNWRDEENKVYIIYSNDEIMEQLYCSKNTATKITRELEEIGIIEKIKTGRANRIYVKNFMSYEDVENSAQNVENSNYNNKKETEKNCESHKKDMKSSKKNNLNLGKWESEGQNLGTINNNINKTNKKEEKSIYLSKFDKDKENAEKNFEKNEGLNLKEITNLLNENNTLSDYETEDDLKNYNEKMRETKNCAIPYCLKKDKQAMNKALKFLSCYSYYFQDNNKDIDIGLANTMLSMLTDFCCDGSVDVNRKHGRKQYYEFIDQINLITQNGSLYDFYLNFKDNLTYAIANERKNQKEIRNMNAFTKTVLMNYVFNNNLEDIKIEGFTKADLDK